MQPSFKAHTNIPMPCIVVRDFLSRTNLLIHDIVFQHLSDGLLYYDPEFFAFLKLNGADDLLFCYR